jgi:transposase InsO family protein
MTEPNAVWTIDFKGQFRTRDSIYCYPLTVADGYSRFLLGCQGFLSPCHMDTKKTMTRLFRDFGLPSIIRSDNGTPFASSAIGRISRLSVWWIKLGIYPELIELGHPEQNGRHERMHRTLKAETARPPAGNLSAQQRRFNAFRTEYNQERPHEALGQVTRRRPLSTRRQPDRSRIASPLSNIPDTSRSEESAGTEASDGTLTGSTSATSWLPSSSASRRSTTTSGTSTSDPYGWAVSMRKNSRSKTLSVANADEKCYPCT